ncbi:FAD-binding oxidoreductase [Desulfuromonas sp. TF]|uniref:FAD-binding oxidoreductase n=1 Tax=Desulfuromonas sp. TF TaxID=1232410 RepID=UPI00040E0F43|nr:FAD-binding oxidoreductase [Desulfuromonas sp. TF]
MSRFVALPKGVSEENFAKAIQDYRAQLGENRVLTDAASLQPYVKEVLPDKLERQMPSAVVTPSSVQDIQAVVRIANNYKTPLWTVCNGENEGYGGSAPATRGQIVLDLRHMNKILHVDEELGYCLLEPGVTYGDLQNHLKTHDSHLWLDSPASSASVSVVGNTLDRGCGYTPYHDHFFFSCGMEVVLGDGTLLRTGMGGVPNSTSWQVFKWGYGPYVDGIFTQGNNGIVTKLGAWLMGAPPAGGYKPFCLRLPKTEMLEKLMGPLVLLRQTHIIPNACALVNAGWESNDRTAHNAGAKGPGGVGAWNLYGAVYGTPEQVELNWGYVTGTFKALFGDQAQIITEQEAKDDPVFQHRKQLMQGRTQSQRYKGGVMQFSAIAPAVASECRQQVRVAEEVLRKHQFDYLSEFIVGWRDARHVIELRFDPAKSEQHRRAHQCYGELLERFSKQGWGVDRANTAFMDKVADTYGPAMKRFNHAIKKALDPNNILAPGKSGISLGA